MTGTVLVARLDSMGDVLLSGPAIRAVAAKAGRVVMLSGERGVDAAQLLPGVDDIIEWTAPWIDAEPRAVDLDHVAMLVSRLAAADVAEAVILTSFHQSPLPLALLLRLAGIQRIAAISDDYPGSLLDVRHRVRSDIPEAVRALSLVRAAGFDLPQYDDGRLRLRADRPCLDDVPLAVPPPYVVLHPGTSVPARAWSPDRYARVVRLLADRGIPSVVTGSSAETALTAHVAGTCGFDFGGKLTLPQLAAVVEGAAAMVVANTGPAHLAAAVGTPVVSLFAPTVPALQWAPYGVTHIVLGDQEAPCRNSRARVCPVPGHPCLDNVRETEVVEALERLLAQHARYRSAATSAVRV